MKSRHLFSEAQLTLSGVLTVGTWLWDMYAQAHGIPYTAPAWLVGAILYPCGGRTYGAIRERFFPPKGIDHKN